jgi:outer membrane receptor for ferrienterochelin and colicin
VKISQLFALKSDTVRFVLLRTWLVTKMKFSLPNIVSIICFSSTPLILAQQTAESFSAKENLSGEVARVVNPGASDSTVIYEAEFFDQYNPITASDMLDRIPGIDVSGRNRGGGGRGLGTGGNLLIDGQRVAGKDNSARDQLDRITAAEVERIEIIRDTSGDLNVRGSGEVINIILIEVPSRSSTQVELLQRLNHDNTYEIGGSVGWSTQIGNFQGLLNLEAQPNYENRDNREARITPDGELLGTLFEENIRDQDKQNISANMSYGNGAHRMQLNALFSVGDFPPVCAP